MSDGDMKLDYKIRTEGEMNIHDIIWTVPQFIKLLDNKSTRDLRADELSADLIIDCRFQLKMRFLGHDNDIIEIYYLSPKRVFLKLNFAVIRTINTYSGNYKIPKVCNRSIVEDQYNTVQGTKWQHLITFFKQDMTKSNEMYFLKDGNLQLKLQFIVFNINVSESQLLNFGNLLNNGFLSDVIMKSAEGNEYKVHKAVLSSRSAVLKAHFEHSTLECQNNIVMSAFETEVLIEVLAFIYSDQAPRVDEIPDLLLAAADFYQLIGLKSLCEEALSKRLTVESAAETLHLAMLYSADRLKQITLAFIKDGQSISITKTKGWTRVKSVELIKTIYEYHFTDDIVADYK